MIITRTTRMTTTPTTITSILVIASLITTTAAGTAAYGQQQVPPGLQERIAPGGEFIIPILEQRIFQQPECQFGGCALPIYASNQTVVLEGDLLIAMQGSGYQSNHWIWQVVDDIRAQGYAITQISITGEGTSVNPNVYNIVITK